VGCVIGTQGFRKNNIEAYQRDILKQQQEREKQAEQSQKEEHIDAEKNGEIPSIYNQFVGKSLRNQRLVQRNSPTVKYDAEFPSLLFTGSLLPPREGSLLHEHNVPSYVRAWYGMPNGGFKPVSWDFLDREGGVELHVRGDGRVYDFAYVTFSSADAQWDYICAPFQTTDRSDSLFPLIESMHLGEFWQEEVGKMDSRKDVKVSKVNKRANKWVSQVAKRSKNPHVVHPEEIGLDYDIIRIPWSRFFVRADEKKTNHLVPLPEGARFSYESMNNAGIGIYSEELGDFACEVLFMGVYRDESAMSIEDPNLTVQEERLRRMSEEREKMEASDVWRGSDAEGESSTPNQQEQPQKQKSAHKKDAL